MRLPIIAVASLWIAGTAQLGSAQAQEEQFFAGKTVTLYAGMPVGGGVDDEMRLVARHFSKFIPGQPSIVARICRGPVESCLETICGTTRAADGLTLGMPTRSGFLLSNVVKQSGINYDLADFSYVGGAGSNNITLWLRKPAGISNLDTTAQCQKGNRDRRPRTPNAERARAKGAGKV